jgi:lysophospholipase L1-like esterase
MNISSRFLALRLFLVLPLAVIAATGDGSPTDANLVYVGRWDKSTPSAPHSYWGGAYIRADFTGTSLSVKLGKRVDLAVFIDSKPVSMKMGVNGTVSLASGLSEGNHTVKMVARFQSDEIIFQGFVLAAGAKTIAPTRTKGLIEFVGNSITSGSVTTNGNISAFPWLVGETLGVDRTAISYPGICLVGNGHYSGNGFPGIGQEIQYFKLVTPPITPTTTQPGAKDWDFSVYTPDMVVINLGTNDALAGGISAATVQTSYINMMKKIRAKLPKTRIFAMRPYGGHNEAATKAAVDNLVNGGDKRVYYINTSGWLVTSDYAADKLHPSDAGQIKAAQKLSAVLKPYVDSLVMASGIEHRPDRKAPANGIRLSQGLKLSISTTSTWAQQKGSDRPKGGPGGRTRTPALRMIRCPRTQRTPRKRSPVRRSREPAQDPHASDPEPAPPPEDQRASGTFQDPQAVPLR